ncbi:MAG: hypothetical protein R3A12_11835 [Ignavibacteria bacterium]
MTEYKSLIKEEKDEDAKNDYIIQIQKIVLNEKFQRVWVEKTVRQMILTTSYGSRMIFNFTSGSKRFAYSS